MGGVRLVTPVTVSAVKPTVTTLVVKGTTGKLIDSGGDIADWPLNMSGSPSHCKSIAITEVGGPLEGECCFLSTGLHLSLWGAMVL